MALQDVLKKILDDAAEEVKKIEAETEKEKKKLAEQSTKEGKTELKELEIKTEAALESVEKKIRSMARRETKKRLLAAKRSIISTAMTKFLEHLENVSDETYGHILKELFAKIPPKAGRVLVPAHRKEITGKFAPKDFEIVSDDGISGGFIVRTQDAEIDNSFHNIVFSEFRNELEAFFAQKLALI